MHCLRCFNFNPYVVFERENINGPAFSLFHENVNSITRIICIAHLCHKKITRIATNINGPLSHCFTRMSILSLVSFVSPIYVTRKSLNSNAQMHTHNILEHQSTLEHQRSNTVRPHTGDDASFNECTTVDEHDDFCKQSSSQNRALGYEYFCTA